jgi:hypothetical protein
MRDNSLLSTRLEIVAEDGDASIELPMISGV